MLRGYQSLRILSLLGLKTLIKVEEAHDLYLRVVLDHELLLPASDVRIVKPISGHFTVNFGLSVKTI
jgi:hypothetical protein